MYIHPVTTVHSHFAGEWNHHDDSQENVDGRDDWSFSLPDPPVSEPKTWTETTTDGSLGLRQ